jgi:transcriptional regulator with XRE-family HTH domain
MPVMLQKQELVMNIKKLIGLRIKEIRKNRGFTQEKLAELINVDSGYISKLELGINSPSITKFEILAAALEVKIKDFFDYEHLSKEDLKQELNQSFDRQTEQKQKLIYKIIKSFE